MEEFNETTLFELSLAKIYASKDYFLKLFIIVLIRQKNLDKNEARHLYESITSAGWNFITLFKKSTDKTDFVIIE